MNFKNDPLPTSTSKLLILPGVSGNTEFWHPAAERLAHPAQQGHIGWPGFGSTPPDPSVTGMVDLVARVLPEIGQPIALVAHPWAVSSQCARRWNGPSGSPTWR